MEYKDYSSDFKVYMAIRLEEKRAGIAGKQVYYGVSKPELVGVLAKLSANLTGEEIKTSISNGRASGVIREGSRSSEGNEGHKLVYKIAIASHEMLDNLLKEVGFLEEKLTV